MANERVLMITGATTGIGAATARAAHEAGYRLALSARSSDKLAERHRALGGGDDVFVQTCDVTKPEEIDRFVQAAHERFGRVDVLFANAGVGGQPGGFSGAPVDSWKTILDTNVFGLAVSIQKCLPHLKAQQGHVLITGSVAGRRTLPGSMYGVSKWAANAIGYNLREELKGTGVRVTVIEPGVVDTPFFDDPKPDGLRPEDVANAVMYAISQPATVDLHELLVLPTPPVRVVKTKST